MAKAKTAETDTQGSNAAARFSANLSVESLRVYCPIRSYRLQVG